MTLKLVTAAPADLPKIKELYLSAFSSRRTDPFWLLKKRTKTGIAEFVVSMTMITGSVLSTRSKMPNWSMCSFWRSKKLSALKGYGSGLMELIKERYQGQVIGLSAEKPDATAANNRERLRRLKFYAKMSFTD